MSETVHVVYALHAVVWSDGKHSHACGENAEHEGRCRCKCGATVRNPDFPRQRSSSD